MLRLFERNIPGKEMRSGRSGNVIHAQDRTRWDARGCAWKSHWEETTLCLQTSIQSFLLFQQKLQAFSAPYWRDRRGQPAICFILCILPDHDRCFRFFGHSSFMAYSKILEFYCWELCSCLFVVHLSQLGEFLFLIQQYKWPLWTKQQLFCSRWG